MSIIGNIIWFLFGGILAGYLIIYNIFQISVTGDIRFYGLLKTIGTTPRQLRRIITQEALFLCIIGIPVGLQCFKLGRLSFFPFGKDVVLSGETTSLLLNIFWLIFGGIELAITHAVFAVILCCTIIGIPFGMQHFKLAKLALLPFGAQITDK